MFQIAKFNFFNISKWSTLKSLPWLILWHHDDPMINENDHIFINIYDIWYKRIPTNIFQVFTQKNIFRVFATFVAAARCGFRAAARVVAMVSSCANSQKRLFGANTRNICTRTPEIYNICIYKYIIYETWQMSH